MSSNFWNIVIILLNMQNYIKQYVYNRIGLILFAGTSPKMIID